MNKVLLLLTVTLCCSGIVSASENRVNITHGVEHAEDMLKARFVDAFKSVESTAWECLQFLCLLEGEVRKRSSEGGRIMDELMKKVDSKEMSGYLEKIWSGIAVMAKCKQDWNDVIEACVDLEKVEMVGRNLQQMHVVMMACAFDTMERGMSEEMDVFVERCKVNICNVRGVCRAVTGVEG